MKHAKKAVLAIIAVATVGIGAVNADGFNPRKAVAFYSGHTHDETGTSGAPSHGGGLDSYGCHNKSVPYHCH